MIMSFGQSDQIWDWQKQWLTLLVPSGIENL